MTGEPGRLFFSSLLIVFSVSTGAEPQARAGDIGYVCEQGGAERRVEVVQEPGYACRVKYTKASGASFPWSARNEGDYCRPRAFELVQKLGALGWACDAVEDAKSVLLAQMERYARHLRILANIGKKCFFYPGEAQYGNVCGDARDEAVTVYTCESGADKWEQHLAVFLEGESEPLIMEVGGSGHRQLAGFYIDRERVVMETQKVDALEAVDAPRYPIEKSSIQCRFFETSKWELLEE